MSNSPPVSFQRVKGVFFRAIKIADYGERESFLAAECLGNESLLERVKNLLGSYEDTGHPLDAENFEVAQEELDSLSKDIEKESRFMQDLGKELLQLGDYELLEEVGRGAAGVVYRAKQMSLNREVAVKVVLGSTWMTSAGRKRFQLEAEAAAGLHHRHIVPIYEIGQYEEHEFYSMAYVPRGTLGDHLDRFKSDRKKAVNLVAKVARTMQVAHEQGILHRDLKPGNILLGDDDEPLITDFGLAYDLKENKGLSLTGQVLGTPHYMAPEQAGVGKGAVTTQTDVYSLGAILYELLSGEKVFEADSLPTVLRLLAEEMPVRLRAIDPSISRDLETIISRCLEKGPADRYASAGNLAADLEAWIDGRPISARSLSPSERFLKWVRRKPVHAGLLGTTLLLLLSFGIGGPVVAIQQASLRGIAEEESGRAEVAREAAVEAAELATKRAYANRRLAYASNMRLISTVDYFGQSSAMATQSMLNALRPAFGEDDFRGWEWYYTFGKAHLPTIRFQQKGPVNALGFSPFGESFLVSGKRGTTVHDTLTRFVGRRFASGEEHLHSSWSPDGTRIATVGASGRVLFWNPETGESFASLPGTARYRSLAWGPDGKRLAALESDNTIGFWSIEEHPKRLMQSLQPPFELKQIAWSPNGEFLAGVGESPKVFVWDTEEPDMVLEIYEGHNSPLTTLAWMHDSSWLATGSVNGAIRVWSIPGGHRVASSNMNNGRGPVTSMVWDPDGNVLLNTVDDQEDLLLLDFVLNIHEPFQPFEGVASAVAWNAESHSIVAGTRDGKLAIWRKGLPEVSKVIWQSNSPILSVDWSQNGMEILGSSNGSEFVSLHSETNDKNWSLTRYPKQSDLWAWGSKSEEMVMVWNEGNRLVIDVATPEDPGGGESALDLSSLTPTSLTWPGGEVAFLLEETGAISRVTLKPEISFEPLMAPSARSKASYSTLSASPDRRYLLATSTSGSVLLVSTKDGTVIFEITGQEETSSYHQTHAWHPDSDRFAIPGRKGKISIWSVSDRKKLSEFQAHRETVSALAWHPHGNRIVSGGERGDLFVWDWENGEAMLQLEGHTDLISDLAWDRGGHRLASASHDRTLRVWDATAGILLSRDGLNFKSEE